MVKLLSNLLTGLIIFWLVYNLIYFRVVPRIINHLRRTVVTGRKYDKEVVEILKDDQTNKPADKQ